MPLRKINVEGRRGSTQGLKKESMPATRAIKPFTWVKVYTSY
jgi:hypothetical protein